MKILIIWGESLAKSGGGTVHLLGLGHGLMDLGHELVVIAPRYAGREIHIASLDVRPVRLPRRGIVSFAIFQFLTVLLLPWWLIRHRPAAVYVRTCFFQGMMSLICRLTGRPVVGEVDGLTDVELQMRGTGRLAGWLSRTMDRVNYPLTSGLVCVTRDLRDESIRRGGRAGSTVAIPNGAMTDIMKPGDFAAARERLHLPPDAVIVGFAGTFAAWQGLDFLVQAAGELKKRLGANGGGPLVSGEPVTAARDVPARAASGSSSSSAPSSSSFIQQQQQDEPVRAPALAARTGTSLTPTPLAHRPSVLITLMGGGEMEDSLRRSIAAGGLDDMFILIPPGEQEQVAVFLTAVDAAVIPRNDPRAWRYGNPLKFWDAVSMGLPVFVPAASDLAGVLADLRLPGTFDHTDPASLAGAILDLCPRLEQYRGHRLQVHQQVDAKYSWRSVAGQVAALLERLAGKGGAQ